MREVTRSSADLPDPLVWLIPGRPQVLEQGSLEGPIRLTRVESAATRLMERVHHFPEDIQLQLTVGGVPNTNGHRVFVARQPRNLEFSQPSLARQAIHDL